MTGKSLLVCASICAIGLVPQVTRAGTIGGFVFAKENSAVAYNSPLNPGGRFAKNFVGGDFVAMVSGTWHGLSFRLRGEAVENNSAQSTALRVQELYRSFDLSQAWQLRVGKEVWSWDSGLSFQPLGFFRSQLDIIDPFDEESRVSGLPMIVLNYLGRTYDLQFIASDRLGGGTRVERANSRQWAIRLSRDFDNGLNAAIVLRQHEGSPPGPGFSASYGAGSFELHADAYWGGAARNVNSAIAKGVPPALFALRPRRIELGDAYRVSSVIGLTWTPDDALSVYVEWAHKGEGLSGSQWHRFQSLVAFHDAMVPVSPLALADIAQDFGQLNANGNRRDYGFLMISYGAAPQTVSLSTFVDLADGSAVSTLSVEMPLTDAWSLVARLTALSGSRQSDFGMIPFRAFESLRLTYTF